LSIGYKGRSSLGEELPEPGLVVEAARDAALGEVAVVELLHRLEGPWGEERRGGGVLRCYRKMGEVIVWETRNKNIGGTVFFKLLKIWKRE